MLQTGCSLSLFPGYHPQPSSRAVAPVSWFQKDTGYFLFDTKIDLMKNHFSGLMVIKPDTESSFRVVFITEVGLKIFDLEFMPASGMKVHYILDAMNRKALINKLSSDISLVLMNDAAVKQPDVLRHKDSHDLIFRYKNGNKRNYYFLGETGERPYFARQTSCLVSKVRANFYGNPVTGIDSVKIKHDNLRLDIHFQRIKENSYVAE